MTYRMTILVLVMVAGIVSAQEKIYLYPSSMKVTNPGYEKDKEPPYIQWFKPPSDAADGPAILICPGGGYTVLADQHEGLEVANVFTGKGYHAFVLHYRINNYDQQGHRHPDQYNDVTTAMRTIKSKAKEWKFDPERLGIIGFSAGGHLASMCATMELPANKRSKVGLQQWSSRPAFAVLVYPVIDLSTTGAIKYCSEMLLGRNPDKVMIDSLSTYRRVTANTPPTFIVFANDDSQVIAEHGIKFYQALRENKIPASFHVFDRGAHGFGMGGKDPALNLWPGLCLAWLKRIGF